MSFLTLGLGRLARKSRSTFVLRSCVVPVHVLRYDWWGQDCVGTLDPDEFARSDLDPCGRGNLRALWYLRLGTGAPGTTLHLRRAAGFGHIFGCQHGDIGLGWQRAGNRYRW
jgi:hypothetical protein